MNPSYLEQVPSVIDTSAGIFSSIMSTFWENTAIKNTSDKITTLIINNYTLVFGLVCTCACVSETINFLTGFAIGYWTYDKEITIASNGKTQLQIRVDGIYATPNKQATTLAAAVGIWAFISRGVGCFSAGFLAGAYLRKNMMSLTNASLSS